MNENLQIVIRQQSPGNKSRNKKNLKSENLSTPKKLENIIMNVKLNT